MLNSIPPKRDAMTQELHYRLRRNIYEIEILIRLVRKKRFDSLLPGLHEASEELKAIDAYNPHIDLNQVEAQLEQKTSLMSSTLEILEGDLWKIQAKEHQTYLQLTLCRLIKEAYLDGRMDLLLSLIDVSNTIEKLKVDDAAIDRSSFMEALSNAHQLIGVLSSKEAADVE